MELLDQPWTIDFQTYITWERKKNKLFMPLLLWVLCNMHSDILLTNSVELEGKVKEISKKTNQKKKV